MKKYLVVEKESRSIEREEEKRRKQALKPSNFDMQEKIKAMIPERLYTNLQKAFSKSFETVFEKGVGIIEKTYDKEDLLKSFEIDEFAIEKRGSRKEFANLHKRAKNSSRVNLLLSTVEGSLLGALGIGLPDIVLFTGMLLKGAYETSLHYGYDYDSDSEKFLILQLMEASLAKDDAYMELNQKVNETIKADAIFVPTKEELKEQIIRTSNAMAADMLVMKFVQGFPIVGLAGGLMNPVYYQRIGGYIQLKYRRCHFLAMKNK